MCCLRLCSKLSLVRETKEAFLYSKRGQSLGLREKQNSLSNPMITEAV